MKTLTSSEITNPDEDLLLAAYRKYMRLDFFDYVPYSVNKLHPQIAI